MKGKIVFFVFLVVLGMQVNAQIKWQRVEPGVWKGNVGTPEAYNLLQVSGSSPYKDGFTRLSEAEIPDIISGIKDTVVSGKTYLSFPLQKNEQLYGLGLNFKTVNQRGRILNLHVDHFNGYDNGRTHAPVPFYVSSLGYGIFINSARYMTVYAGSGIRKDSPNASPAKDRNTDRTWNASPYSDEVSVLIPANGVEIYVFAGPTPMDVVRRYNLLCGGGTLPPRWGLGITQRVHTLYTTEQVEKEIDDFDRHGYPLDFIGLEPGWQSKAYPCSFEWDPSRYPMPEEFISKLLGRGIRLNLWTNPYVSPESKLYEAIYALSGSHTVWGGVVPDLANGKARALLKNKWEKEHVSMGIGGYKIDEVDGYDRWLWPDVATFPSGIPSEMIRQTYGLWLQRMTNDIYREKNRRTYGLVRASNGGASSFPYVIYNDYYNHRDFITALGNSGFCGILWTPEVRKAQTPEEWLRRFQTVVFSPMAMIDAWSSGLKPWSFPEVNEQIKEYALLRMRMMPYWYTEFARYRFDGIPPFRSMNLEPGFDVQESLKSTLQKSDLEKNPYLEKVTQEVKDQYMAGEYLLVAPLFAGENGRQVVLPEGNWYDFYTGEYVGNGEIIMVTSTLDRIPVYVKDGGIIPMLKHAALRTPHIGQTFDLEIRHYGKADGNYRLYDDDGETFDYERGEFSWREITVRHDKKGYLKGSISKVEKGKPDNIANITWKFMTE